MMSGRIQSLRASIPPIAVMSCCVGLLGVAQTRGGWRAVQVAAIVLVPAIGFAVGWAAHRRRKAMARSSEGFGSSSSQHVDDLRTVPRFAPSVERMQRLDATKGWIGGGVTIGPRGIRWEPSAFSRRFRHVPAMQVDWREVQAVRTEALKGIGRPAAVHVDLDDGSTWTLNATPVQDLRRALGRYAPRVDAPTA